MSKYETPAGVEIRVEGPLDMFFPKMLQREFYIRTPEDIEVGKSVVRFKNGKRKCYVEELNDGVYKLWDGSGTSGSVRYLEFEELKKYWVVVKFMDMCKYYIGIKIDKIEDLEADYKAESDGYNYHEAYKFIRHKKTGEIRRFECKSIDLSKPHHESFHYKDESHILKEHPLNLHGEITMKNDEILSEWEMIIPEFKTLER